MRMIKIVSKLEIEVTLTLRDLDIIDRALSTYVPADPQEVVGAALLIEDQPDILNVLDLGLFVRGLILILAEYDPTKDTQIGDNGHKNGGPDGETH